MAQFRSITSIILCYLIIEITTSTDTGGNVKTDSIFSISAHLNKSISDAYKLNIKIEGLKTCDPNKIIGSSNIVTESPLFSTEASIEHSRAEIRNLKGEPGLNGSKGEKGDNGRDGTGLKGDPVINGLPGTDGENGLKGEPGLNGSKGEKGDNGRDGIGLKGEQGLKGDSGSNGEKGERGDNGREGPRGLQGPKGDRGPQGPPGLNGTPGTPGLKGEPCKGPHKGESPHPLGSEGNPCDSCEDIDVSGPVFINKKEPFNVTCNKDAKKVCLKTDSLTVISNTITTTSLWLSEKEFKLHDFYQIKPSQMSYLVSLSTGAHEIIRISPKLNDERDVNKQLKALLWNDVVVGSNPSSETPMSYKILDSGDIPHEYTITETKSETYSYIKFESDLNGRLPVIDFNVKHFRGIIEKITVQVMELCFDYTSNR